MPHCLRDAGRQGILLTCQEPEFTAMPPGQIVPVLADQVLFNSCGEGFVYGSEQSFYRLLHTHGQTHSRGQCCTRDQET